MNMRKTISLSKHVGVSREALEEVGVFDATLGLDTKLFIDPKLLVASDIPEFARSRVAILEYFAKLLRVHKQSHKAPRLQDVAVGMLAVPEPKGFSIGYGNKTDKGTAVSKTVAKSILLSATEIVSVGIEDEELVELLGMFVPGFGPDSISDLTISIVYEDFCKYTQRICKELKIKTKEASVNGKAYQLPRHPYLETHIVFAPHSLLRPLPVAVSWDEISAAAERSRELRRDLNEIVFPVLKETLEEFKDKSPQEKKEFRNGFSKLLQLYRKVEVEPYDLRSDPKGYYLIQPFVEGETPQIKASFAPRTPEQLITSVRELVGQFQRSIEDNGGNTLLYKRTSTGKLLKEKPHNEDVAQTMFYMIADVFCSTANIMLSRESDAGLGPVDFSLGTGYDSKVVVEIKKSTNRELESGYEKQVQAYQKSEKAVHSFFVVVVVKPGKKRSDELNPQLQRIKVAFEEKKAKKIPTPELVIIDGLVHPSPSKLRIEPK